VNHLPDGKDLPVLSRSLFSEAAYNGIGFGLGFSVTLDPARTMLVQIPSEAEQAFRMKPNTDSD